MDGPPKLVTLADIARLTGVQRPAASNWRRRHHDFPSPVENVVPEAFEASAVAEWLDRRRIPRNALRPDEAPGTTFGDRFLSARAVSSTVGGAAPGHEWPVHVCEVHRSQPEGRDQATFRESGEREGLMLTRFLLGALQRAEPFGDLSDYGDLYAGLVYLRATAPERWSRLARDIRAGEFADSGAVVRQVLTELKAEEPAWADVPLPTGDHRRAGGVLLEYFTKGHPDPPAEDTPSSTRFPAAQVYEALRAGTAALEGHRGGEFYTPHAVAQVMTGLIESWEGKRIHDPCCGSGELLAAAATRTRDPATAHFSGSAIGVRAWRLASMNLRIHGAVHAEIRPDALEVLRRGLRPLGRFDIILSNPPFNLSAWTEEVDQADLRWLYGTPPRRNANFAWLQHIAALLSDRGRAVVVMANGAATTKGRTEYAIRAAMVEDGVVECVVALPPGLFMSTAVPATLWVIRKPVGRSWPVLFVDASELGERTARTTGGASRTLSNTEARLISRTYRAWRRGRSASLPPLSPAFARQVAPEEIRERDYTLSPPTYMWPAAAPDDAESLQADIERSRSRLAGLEERAARIDAELTRLLRGER